MSRYFTPTLAGLSPYTPGEQPQDQQYIKLNTNESPYSPSPSGSANAMNVVFIILWNIIVAYQFHIIDVNAARRHIGGDQDRISAAAVLLHHIGAMLLLHIAVQR